MNKFFAAVNFFATGLAIDQMLTHTGSPLAPLWLVCNLMGGALSLAALQSKIRQPLD